VPLLKLFISSLMLLVFAACQSERPPVEEQAYRAGVEAWHQNRLKRLTSKTGWLTLVGLYWLKPGENTFGSDASNAIVFPQDAPGRIGTFILKDDQVSVEIDPAMDVRHQGKRITRMVLTPDTEPDFTVLRLNSLAWHIIKRGDQFGVRLRDLESPAVAAFQGIERYPVDLRWRLRAALLAYDPPKTIAVPTVLGTTIHESSPGALVFLLDGKTYKIDVLENGAGYWTIFGDATNGEETYGAGRFLVIDEPDSLGNIYLDFNYAYNPPCAFTKYATCPLPPPQNRLPVAITAGEKKYAGGITDSTHVVHTEWNR